MKGFHGLAGSRAAKLVMLVLKPLLHLRRLAFFTASALASCRLSYLSESSKSFGKRYFLLLREFPHRLVDAGVCLNRDSVLRLLRLPRDPAAKLQQKLGCSIDRAGLPGTYPARPGCLDHVPDELVKILS